MAMDNVSLEEFVKSCNSRLEKIFKHYLIGVPSEELKNAMEYSLLNSGKHLRPLLVYATSHIFNAPLENADLPAAAVEMIHTYSLIHDDLPCMDNADLRRGKPSSHKKFGEGMAVLVGDGLQTLAMQVIAGQNANLNPQRRVYMLKVLSEAAGVYGMVGGQALDIANMNEPAISKELLEKIHRLKTGALFTASILLGWLASNDEDQKNQQALKKFGDLIGLAFQVQDDILDVEAGTDVLGKSQGIDSQNKKVTYPSLYGLPEAKQKMQQLYHEALDTIAYLGESTRILRELINYMLVREK